MQPIPHSPLIIWPCYEPAGYRVALTEAELVQHVLLVGSTGSGKSTLLTSAMEQLIAYDAAAPARKIGLLILDAKGDDIVARVQVAANAAGRSGDVMVFGPGGTHAYDLFGGLRTLNDVDRITRQLMLGAEKFGKDNAYWEQASTAMINAALTLLVATRRTLTFEAVVDFMRRWFLSPLPSPELQELLKVVTNSRRKGHPLLAAAVDQVQLWSVLDSRTRSNLQSCLLNVLRPLLSPSAIKCFDARCRPNGNPEQLAAVGHLGVISVNALSEPELAKFFFQLAKQSFFDAVQQRTGNHHRLCGLIADEFPLVVTRDDPEQVCTVRSKRCFVMAAVQGLHSISERVGVGAMRILLNNFNTTVFLRCREAETAVQAHVALGMRSPPKRPTPPFDTGMLGLLPPPTNPGPTEIPVCPMGALGQLDAHQAFIVFADGKRTETPVWFVPWFEQPERTQPAPLKINPSKSSAAHIEQLMVADGFKTIYSPDLVMKAAAIGRKKRRGVLRRVNAFFLSKACMVPDGLDILPESWLAALPGILWNLRQSHWTKLPFFIERVEIQAGLLLLHFAQEQPEPANRVTAWDLIRVAVNASLYPSRYRPLHRWHRAKLRQLHPDLLPTLPASEPTLS